MKETPRYRMTLNLNILKHLGIRLYSNSVAVITEAVANAYDADATVVKIQIGGDDEKAIFITDNGNGMSLDDVNLRFLTVGYDRRSDDQRQDASCTKLNRRVMGRKGLGKLSLFSIASTVDVYTRKLNQLPEAFQLDANVIESVIGATSASNEYLPTVVDPKSWDIPDAFVGTRIKLTNLKSSRLVSPAQLKQRLARRFAVIGPLSNFEVQVNDDAITIADRHYFAKLQYIWLYGSTVYRANMVAELAAYKNIKKVNENDGAILPGDYAIDGWIGTSREPGDLAQNKSNPEAENLNSIILLARGRPIQENILDKINDGRLYTKYLVGELNADFLDEDGKEDIATSSRQSIIEDDDRYVALKEFVSSALGAIASDWTDFRNADGGREALQDLPVLKEWLDTLTSTAQRKSATQLLSRIQSLPIDDASSRGELFKHGILAFERLRMRDNLALLDSIETFDSAQFRLIVEEVDAIEASLYLEMIKERLSIIEKLKDLTDENALEKEIQNLVFEKLWLIEPSWERGTDALVMEETLGKTFKAATALSAEEQKARLDIRYKRSADSHIIIELKRASRKDLTYNSLYVQGHKYVSGLRKGLVEDGKPEPHIQVIFLLGSEPKSDLPTDPQLFRNINARFLTYRQLVTNALTVYRHYLEAKSSKDYLRKIVDSLSSATRK